MDREFQKNELVILLTPERDGFTPVIYLHSLDEGFHQVVDPETGTTLAVSERRLSKVRNDEREEDT